MASLPDGRHFKASEAACKDGTPYPEEWPDCWALSCGLADAVRDEYGSALEAVSWYRSPAYNQALIDADAKRGVHGVASGSQHVQGLAIDLRPVSGNADQLYRVVLAAYEAGRLPMLGGVGLYSLSNWVHCDAREKVPAGHLARWVGV